MAGLFCLPISLELTDLVVCTEVHAGALVRESHSPSIDVQRTNDESPRLFGTVLPVFRLEG